MMSAEMGKPLFDARAEVLKSASAADQVAQIFEEELKPVPVSGDAGQTYMVVSEATGPILAIMPWNFPIWQIMRIVPAAMAVVNPVLLKHSDLTAGTAEIFAKIVQEIFGPQMFQNLTLDHEQAARVIQDPRIRAVTMTGSSRGGREIAGTAGRALKKVVLELGGSDPYLVFEDADLEKAAKACAAARLVNNGQSCVAGKRFLIHESVFEKFVGLFQAEMKTLMIGDPKKEETRLGPLASLKFRDGLGEQTARLQQQGGRKVFERELGSGPEFQKGAFFAPQIWEVTGRELIVREEEFFGPVALVMKFKTEDEAVALANSSVYGLGGGVFSGNGERLLRVARRIQSGLVACNDFVKSDAKVPFGGFKDSGFGRELGVAGLREFVSFKTLSGLQGRGG
jgi:succinate-semialdehyde dehydrogenase/glutarate-semialdehyde dehydrogenase